MNPFLFSLVALCLVASACASGSGQYGQAQGYNSGYNQRKMAPSPQTYGQQQAYGGPEQQQQQRYGNEMSYNGEQNYYSAPAPAAYRAPSSAQVSTYDERTPAATGYGRQQSYAAKPQQSYAAAPAAGYAKPAPAKYEEPQYHAPMPFAWGYDINDGYGGAQYHKETGDEYGKRTGSYGYTDAYGVYRQVDYVADEYGFRATIKTNEPGTANESPADVELHAYEPPSNYYAGNNNNYGAQQQSYAAPASGYAAKQAPAKSYASAPASYSAPQASYGAQRSYARQQSSYGAAPAARPTYQEQQAYSSSAIVPVYTKTAASAPVAAATAPTKGKNY